MAVASVNCDECGASLDAKAHKCCKCKDFVYCSICLPHAHLLHPGHDFTDVIISNYQNAEIEEREASRPGSDGRESAMRNALPSTMEITSSVCTGCLKITMPTSSVLTEENFVPDEYRERPSVPYTCRVRLSKLVAGMQQECAFCSLLLDTFIGSDGGGGIQVTAYEVPRLWYTASDARRHAQAQRSKLAERCMDFLTKMDSDVIVLGVELHRKKNSTSSDFDGMAIAVVDDPENSQFFVDNFRRPSLFTPRLKLDLFASYGGLLAKSISTRPPNASPASEQGIERVRKWLGTCVQTHRETCPATSKGTNSLLPSLLVDVSDLERLHIHESAPKERGEYCALSYCWGGPQAFQTTSATLMARLNGFSVTVLPRTLQDAVKLTHELSVKYLWVDSICIIQDSEDHRTYQLSRMGEIYMNATLTICAARCSTADGSFLEDRADAATGVHKNLVFFNILQLEDADVSSGPRSKKRVQAVGNLWLMESNVPFLKDPISHRAWCLQESTLSPRIVYYERLRPIWRCNGCIEGDGGPEVDGAVFPLNQTVLNQAIHHRQALAKDARYSSEMDKTAIVRDIHLNWQRTLEDYTMRELSFDHDKFPAIGGIATEIFKLTGDAYAAGIWLSTCLQDLMWTTKKKEWLHRSAERRAPTWSWASTNCPIRYDAVTEDAVAVARVIRCNISRPEDARSKELSLATLPHVSEIGEGELIVQGSLKKLDREHAKSIVQHSLAGPGPDTADQLPFEQSLFGYMHQMAGPDHSEHGPYQGYFYSKPEPGAEQQAVQATNQRIQEESDVIGSMLQRIVEGEQMLSYEETEQEIKAKSSGPRDDFPENAYMLILFARSETGGSQKDSDKDRASYSGLLLTKLADGTFERIGSFSNESYRIYHPADADVKFEETQITIV